MCSIEWMMVSFSVLGETGIGANLETGRSFGHCIFQVTLKHPECQVGTQVNRPGALRARERLYINVGLATKRCVLVSWGRHNKSPQTWCLKTTEICSLQFLSLEVQSQGVLGAMFPLKTLGSILPCLFQPLTATSNSLHSLAYSHRAAVSASVFILPFPLLRVFSPVCVYLFVFYRTPVTLFCDHLENPGWSHLKVHNVITSMKALFQIRPHL